MNEKINQIFHGTVRITEKDGFLYPFRLTEKQFEYYKEKPECPYQNATANIFMEFSTDKEEIKFSYQVYEKWDWLPNRSIYFDVYENGALMGIFELKQEGCFHYMKQSKERTVLRICLPHNAAVCVGDFDLGNYEPTPMRDRKLLVLGDSISQGLMGNSGVQNYVTHVTNHFDMEVLNQSVGGDRFSVDKVDEKLPFSPTDVLVALGTNDITWSDTMDEIREHISSMLEKLCHLYGNEHITILSPIRSFCVEEGYEAPERPRGRKIKEWPFYCKKVREEIKRQGERLQIPVIEGYELLPLEQRYFTDEEHPNDLGFALMALNFIKVYK